MSLTLAQTNSAVTAAVYSLIRYDVFEKLETKINKHPISLKCNVSKHIWLRLLIPFFQSHAFLPFTDMERKQIHYELRKTEDIPYSTSKRKRETYTWYI